MLSIEDFKSPLFESQNSAIDGSWAPGERERWETVTSGFAHFDLSEEAIPVMREAIKPDPAVAALKSRKSSNAARWKYCLLMLTLKL